MVRFEIEILVYIVVFVRVVDDVRYWVLVRVYFDFEFLNVIEV